MVTIKLSKWYEKEFVHEPTGSKVKAMGGDRKVYVTGHDPPGQGYEAKLSHATRKGWSRLAIYKDPERKELSGINQTNTWTPRHDRAMRLIKKAIKAHDYKDNVDRMDPY